jgi:diacylglycerol O-acyltransferase
MSYNGRLNFGILGDYDAVQDIQVIADGISDSRDDLLDATTQVKTKVREVMRSGTDVEALASVADSAAKTAAKAKAKRPAAAKKTVATKKPAAKSSNGATPQA